MQFKLVYNICQIVIFFIYTSKLGFNQISAPSKDPSPPLPFWDKMRLLMHGRLTMMVQRLQVLLHASLDPYNTTEEMALTWENVVMDWTNGEYLLNLKELFLCWY